MFAIDSPGDFKYDQWVWESELEYFESRLVGGRRGDDKTHICNIRAPIAPITFAHAVGCLRE